MRMCALVSFTVLAGCMSADHIAVRNAARPDAEAVLADAPNLLPSIPVTSTSTTRSQAPEVVPAATDSQAVALRTRATVNGIPIMDEEVRQAVAPLTETAGARPTAGRFPKGSSVTQVTRSA